MKDELSRYDYSLAKTVRVLLAAGIFLGFGLGTAETAVAGQASAPEEPAFLGRSLAAWRGSLDDVDENVRESAAWALGKMGAAARPAAPALRERLRDKEDRVRHSAMVALCRVAPDDPESYPALLMAVADYDEGIRSEAARALAKPGPIRRLIQDLGGDVPATRARSATALGLAGVGDREVAAALVLALKDRDAFVGDDASLGRHKWVGEAAAKALGRLTVDSVDIGTGLVEALRAGDERVRAAAAESLGRLRVKAAVGALAEAVHDDNEFVTANAAEALGALGPDAAPAVPSLIRGFARPGRSHIYYPKTMAAIGEPAVKPLMEALPNENLFIRLTSAECLTAIGPPGRPATGALLSTLKDGDLSVRRQAVEALGAIGAATDDVVTALLAASEDKYIAPAAFEALRKLSSSNPRVVPALERMQSGAGPGVRDAARSVLVRIPLASREAVSTLIQTLHDDPAWEARNYAAARLGEARAAFDLVVPALIRALDDKNPYVARSAAMGLGQMGPAGKAAVPALLAQVSRGGPLAAGAAGILSRLAPDDPEVTRALIGAMKSPNSIVRNSIIFALARVNPADPAVVRALVAALDDPATEVRDPAVRTLGKLGAERPEVVPALVRVLGDQNVMIVEDAVTALGNIGPPAKVAVPRLYAMGTRGAAREEVVAALAKIGPVSKEELVELSRSLAEIEKAPPRAAELHPRFVMQKGPTREVHEVAASADGSRVITDGDKRLILWDADTGMELRRFSTATGSLARLVLSPDGTRALIGGGDQPKAAVWDLTSGEVEVEFKLPGKLTDAAFSADAATVLLAVDSTASLRRARDGRVLKSLTGATPIRTVALSADARRAVTTDGQVAICWDLDSAGELWRIRASTSFRSAAFARANYRLAVADGKTVVIYDTNVGKPLRTLKGDEATILQLHFSTDGLRLLTLDENGSAFLWDIESERIQGRADGRSIAFAAAGPRAFSVEGPSMKSVAVTDVATGKTLVRLEGRVRFLASAAFSQDGRRILIGGWNGATLWDLTRGGATRRFQHPPTLTPESQRANLGRWRTGNIMKAAISPDGSRVMTGASDKLAILWDASSGRLLQSISGASTAESVAFSPDGKEAVVGRTHEAELYELDPFRSVHHWKGLQGQVTGVAFSPDGKRVLTGGVESIIWDVETGKEVKRLDMTPMSGAVAFSPDGTTCLSGFRNFVVYWDARTGRSKRLMMGESVATARSEDDLKLRAGHTDFVAAVAFSKDGSKAFTGGGDGVAILWDLASGEVVRRFEGHEAEITAVAFSREGEQALTASLDGTCSIWELGDASKRWTMVPFNDSDWAVVDDVGRFDSGRIESAPLAWVFADDPFRPLPPEVFMRDYFEPRLLPRVLGGESLPEVRPLGNLNRARSWVTDLMVAPTDRREVAEVTVAASGATADFRRGDKKVAMHTGAYDVRLFRDGQLVGRWPEPAAGDDAIPEPDPTDPKQMAAWRDANRVELDATGKATTTFVVRLPRAPGRKVEFTAYVFNEDRVKSATATAVYEVPKGVAPAKPKAYVVAFGAAGFSDPAWDLSFAAADARLAAQELGKALKAAGRYEVVPVVLAADRGRAGRPPRPGEGVATKANLKAVVGRLAGGPGDAAALAAIPGSGALSVATPDDLVVVFASSHGYTDRRGAYYLFPSDIGEPRANGRSIDEKRDKALLHACVSSGELSAWLRPVDAGQLALIVDCCHAAATVEQPGFKPGPMGSRGLGQLAYDKAMRVLAASAADDVALEAVVKGEGNGLLTYALIREGLMKSKAAEPVRGLTLGGLLQYAEGRVPTLYAEVVKAAEGSKGEAGRARVLVTRGAELEPLGGEGAPPESTLRKKNTFQSPTLFNYARGRDVILGAKE